MTAVDSSMAFKNHFSDGADAYRQFRPHYPESLFAYLATLCPGRELAWDCATGNGQAARGLAPFFRQVIATDASEAQIAHARHEHDNLTYAVGSAEHSGLDAGCVDLLTVAQALHWFDIDAFSSEVDRVLAAQGVVGVWTYNLLTIGDEIDNVIFHLYKEVLRDYWPAERKIVEDGYARVALPFAPIRCPSFEMSCEWRFSELIGYLNTWSAVRAFERDQGINPVQRLQDDIARAWGDPGHARMIRWPLTLRAWHKA